jgi:hypothetical protein
MYASSILSDPPSPPPPIDQLYFYMYVNFMPSLFLLENKAGQKLLFCDFAIKYEWYEVAIVIFKLVGFCRACARLLKLNNTKT